MPAAVALACSAPHTSIEASTMKSPSASREKAQHGEKGERGQDMNLVLAVAGNCSCRQIGRHRWDVRTKARVIRVALADALLA
jgi:hypothetical protein